MVTVVPKWARKHNFSYYFFRSHLYFKIANSLFLSVLFCSFPDEVWVPSSASIVHVMFLQGGKEENTILVLEDK